MKNSELIAQLQQFPPDALVCIADPLKNLYYDDGDGSGAGIYPDFQASLENNSADPEAGGPKQFVALTFQNEEYLERRCRICGCTESNCSQCIEKTGSPCHWVEEDLCSACVPQIQKPSILLPGKDF